MIGFVTVFIIIIVGFNLALFKALGAWALLILAAEIIAAIIGWMSS